MFECFQMFKVQKTQVVQLRKYISMTRQACVPTSYGVWIGNVKFQKKNRKSRTKQVQNTTILMFNCAKDERLRGRQKTQVVVGLEDIRGYKRELRQQMRRSTNGIYKWLVAVVEGPLKGANAFQPCLFDLTFLMASHSCRREGPSRSSSS